MDKTQKTRKTVKTIAMFGLSAVLLTVIQAPFDMGCLAWGSLVPFILACSENISTKKLLITSYTVSAVYWLANLYWVGLVIVPGYIALSLVMAMYQPIAALCIRHLRRQKITMIIQGAFVFAGLEAIRCILFTGFGFRLLAHSQYNNITIIQIADIFGTIGVSFIIAIVNVFIAEVIINIQQGRFKLSNEAIKGLCVAVIIAAAVFYGRWQLRQSPKFITDGPVVAAVQPNIPSKIKECSENAEKILFCIGKLFQSWCKIGCMARNNHIRTNQ